jgi:hypothetical protein
MFARTCPRMGVRFASGNVYYMNRTFTARHLQCVSSPLYTGFITPMRFHSSSNGLNATFAPSGAVTPFGSSALVEASLLAEPVGCNRTARQEIMKVLGGYSTVPTCVLKDCFVCASVDAQTATDAIAPPARRR